MASLIWIILDILLGLTTIIVWIGIEGDETLKYALMSAFLFLSLILLLWGRKKVLPILKTQTFKNYSRELTTILLTLFIVLVINFLGVKNNYQMDMTSIKLHTLSQQTENILKLYEKPLKVRYISEKKNWGRFEELLAKYQNLNPKFSYEFVDPNENPALVSQYNLKTEGSAIINYEESETYGAANSELKLTNLLIKLSRREDFLVCYDDSHKELSFEDESKEGLSFLAGSLRDSLYNLKKIDLLTESMIPRECDLFMIMGPRASFMDAEILKVEKYLTEGGNLFISLAPVFGQNQLQNIFTLLENNGVKVENSVVIDRLASVQGSQATIPLINEYDSHHSVTKGFKERTIFALTTALTSTSESEKFRYTGLAKTSPFPASWAEKDLTAISQGNAKYDLDIDIAGPIDVLAVSENLTTFSRVAVMGSSSVAINAYQGNAANFNLVLNTISWLMDDTGLVSLNRPNLSQERVFVSEGQMNLILFLTLGLIPLILFIVGFYMFKRRNSH